MVAAYLISTIVYACLFALMAIGLTLTYMTTKVPNFAYGSFVTIGIYSAYTLVREFKFSPYAGGILAFALGAGASALMYIAVLRPMARRGSSLVSLMIATFGIDIGFIGIFGIYTDYLATTSALRDTKQFYQLGPDFTLGGVQGIVLVAPLALALITVGIYLLFTRTKFGVAMRASVENPPLAKVLGINVERVYVVSWMLAGGLAGLAGALYTLWLPGGTSVGSNLIVEIFASSVLGGLTSIFGSILGGLVIGGSENLVTIGLAQGLGYVGAGIIAALAILGGVLSWKSRTRVRVAGLLAAALGVYIFVEMALGFPSDLFAAGLVNGFGANVTPFQKAIPLMIMVGTLILFPKGLVSLDLKKLVRKVRR